ncbi:MAG: hypothetical protein ABIH82_06505 [Candidatus Woesearchaeota archaeon]
MIAKTELDRLFGRVEIETMLKRIKGKPLKQTERNYLSKSIRPKLRSILTVSKSNLFREMNTTEKQLTSQEIIYNLSRFNYDLISLNKNKGKEISLEELIIKIIIQNPQARFIEAIPILLLKNKTNRFKLLDLASTYQIKNELGYLIETALLIKKNKELAELLSYLKQYKDKQQRILGEEMGDTYKDFLLLNTPTRLRLWNLLGRFFDNDFKNLARGYL